MFVGHWKFHSVVGQSKQVLESIPKRKLNQVQSKNEDFTIPRGPFG